MLVIVTDQQIISTKQVCNSCLMADSSGLPRWRQGKLNCGHLLENSKDEQTKFYRCEMGFCVTDIK